MEENTADLIEALDDHTQTESVGEGGDGGKVACWLTAEGIKNRDEVKANITLLAEAYGYEYSRGSLESNGFIVVFAPAAN